MAHAFDSGLSAPFETLMRSGIVTLLSGLHVSAGGYLRSVEAFGSIIRSWMDGEGVEDLYQALNGRAPAILVAIGDCSSKPIGQTGFQFLDEYEVFLYCASNNARQHVTAVGRAAADVTAIADDTADPGLDIIKAHAKELIIGQRAGVVHGAVKQIRPERSELLTARDDITIWMQTYRISTQLTINPDRGVTQMLESIHWRTTQENEEVQLPDAAESPTTIDVSVDGLPT